MAVITFVLITFNKIKYGGIKGYLKGFLEPIFVMAPLNVLSEIATPVSMSFRSLRQHGRRPGYHHAHHGRTQGAV